MRTVTVVGAKIAQARELQGLTQRALAGKLGIDRSLVAHWEAGRRSPGTLLFNPLCRALACEPADLLAVADDAA